MKMLWGMMIVYFLTYIWEDFVACYKINNSKYTFIWCSQRYLSPPLIILLDRVASFGQWNGIAMSTKALNELSWFGSSLALWWIFHRVEFLGSLFFSCWKALYWCCKDFYTLTPRICEYVILNDKRDFLNVIKWSSPPLLQICLPVVNHSPKILGFKWKIPAINNS